MDRRKHGSAPQPSAFFALCNDDFWRASRGAVDHLAREEISPCGDWTVPGGRFAFVSRWRLSIRQRRSLTLTKKSDGTNSKSMGYWQRRAARGAAAAAAAASSSSAGVGDGCSAGTVTAAGSNRAGAPVSNRGFLLFACDANCQPVTSGLGMLKYKFGGLGEARHDGQ